MISSENEFVAQQCSELREKGVVLQEGDIRFVLSNFQEGMDDTRVFLGRSDEIKLTHSRFLGEIGFDAGKCAIEIPIVFFNCFTNVDVPLGEHFIEIDFSPPFYFQKRPRKIPFSYFLRLVGREEAVHFFQRKGDPRLQAAIYFAPPEDLSSVSKQLCDVEVEARQIVGEICVGSGEEPFWVDYDDLLTDLYPHHYGRSIEYLLNKPPRIITGE